MSKKIEKNGDFIDTDVYSGIEFNSVTNSS